MQLGTLQISLNSSAIRSHSSEVGTLLHMLVAVPSKWPFRTHVQYNAMYCILSNWTKSNPKMQIVPQWQDTESGFSFSDFQKCKDK